MVKKLMAILAHPDDESLGNGGMLAKYAAEGIEIHLVVATRGERGWPGKESEYPGLETLQQKKALFRSVSFCLSNQARFACSSFTSEKSNPPQSALCAINKVM
jgi:GlcNAc-PI de-N-acetylase